MKQAFNTELADIRCQKEKSIQLIVNWDIIALKLGRLYAQGQRHIRCPSY